jgi:fermentation-respiration switch protein FrsA (DUF1100 family)
MPEFVVIGISGLIASIAIYLVLIGLVLDLEVPAWPLEGGGDAAEDPGTPRRDVEFEVGGTLVRAWLYLPEAAAAPVPCIVMAHGFGGTKAAGLARYASRFREAGFAVLVFDYRFFGESDGEPRQLYWIPHQLADWTAAIAYARSLPEVDASRVALWGSSASGGHVIVAAAADPEIACISSQCPGLDARAEGARVREREGLGHLLRLVMHGQRDMLRSRLGLSAHRIPIVGPPGSVAILASPDALDGFGALAPEGFVNEVCARIVLRAGSYRPIEHANDVRCPVLLQICLADQLASAEVAEQTAERLGERAEVKRYPIGHFDIYRGDHYETAVRDQLEFFTRHLA